MNDICPSCKDDLDDTVYKLSCGHKYHYLCIYESFLHNINNIVKRECPYCRKSVEPLELRDGYTEIDSIHNTNKHKYLGYNYKYCGYNGCNTIIPTYSTSCKLHNNLIHKGELYCKYMSKSSKYCNRYLLYNENTMCKKHSNYINMKICPKCKIYHNESGEYCKFDDIKNACTAILKSGNRKGSQCGKICCGKHKILVI